MSNNVDLTSKEWCDLVFEGKNKDFGAYQLRRTSIARHNKALVYTLLGFAALVLLLFCWSFYQDYQEEQRKLLLEQQQQTMQAQMPEEISEEEEEEAIQEQKEEEKPEEVVEAQQQVTELVIVQDDKVTQPPKTNEQVQEDKADVGAQNVDGIVGALSGEIKAETPKAAPVVVEQKVQVEAPKEENKVFTSVEQMPTFPGGDAALLKYIGSHLQYPAMAAEQGIEGRCVVRFVVTKSGKVGDVNVVRSLSPDCDNEAKRVCKSLPAFTPGRQNGQAVNVWYTLPITFKLQK